MEQRPIWDFPTRLFHWSLALSLTGSWITAEAGFDWTDVHFYCGYFTLGLILFRLIWGFFGTPYARFRQFLKSPLKIPSDLKHLFSPTPSLSHGHSTIGGWAVVALLSVVTLQAVTGLFVSDDIFYAGPYNPAVSSDLAGNLAYIHHQNFIVLQVLVGIHILVIAWYAWRKKENLTAAMITGNKSVDPPSTEPVATPWLKFVLIAATAAIAIVLLIQLAPEPVYLY